MQRHTKAESASIANTDQLSTAIDTKDKSTGQVLIPAGWTGGDTATFLTAGPEGTFAPVRKSDGSLVTLTLAGVYAAAEWYDLPPECLRASQLKLVPASAVSRDESLQFALKS